MVRFHMLTTRGHDQVRPELAVVSSECGLTMWVATVQRGLHRLYQTLGMTGGFSHSGRRIFIISIDMIRNTDCGSLIP